MTLSATLSYYLGRQFLSWLAGIFLCFMMIALLFDFVEMMRRAASKDQASIGIVLQMTLFKLPHLLQTTLPFMVLFAGMFSFWRLARANEAVVSRAAGISAWQIILPAILIVAGIGILQVAVINPFAAAMLTKYEKLEADYLEGRTSMLAVSKSGLWLRQVNDDGGYSVIHALRVAQEEMDLRDVIIFRFSDKNQFIERIDARSAQLKDKHWLIPAGWRSTPTNVSQAFLAMKIKTDLTENRILESFAPPETMSFWDLPAFIDLLEASGFSGHRHRLHFHALLAYPLLLCSMILIAASFTLRINRRTRATVTLLGGLMCSFFLYFLTDVVHALGLSASIPIPLAAWTPAGVSTLIGLAMLFHLEDG